MVTDWGHSLSKLERALIIALAVIFVVVVAGTVWAGLTGSRARKLARETVPTGMTDAGVYDGLGRIRARTSGGRSAVVVVDIAFPYDASDRQFREELARKRGDLKSAATSFFASRTIEELHPSNEAVIKAALRDTLNGLLSLGSIEELYFSEFRAIE
ncbi:MAG: hypothetical protein CVV47_14360 [Spirochaetae bacterium HGW-Spirochaetae-3]|jgi:flagellar basal body-associated protein FliL|nr:MAG: hypothetical protein CVV47_14360 [Spirochaetae bacterium HGW-Spirochaetae-3]